MTNRNLRTSIEMEKQNIQEALEIKQEFKGKGSIVWELVCCRKPNCRCQSGALHGPYPYLHFWSEGRVRRKYLTKAVGRLVPCPKRDLEQRLLEITACPKTTARGES